MTSFDFVGPDDSTGVFLALSGCYVRVRDICAVYASDTEFAPGQCGMIIRTVDGHAHGVPCVSMEEAVQISGDLVDAMVKAGAR